MTEVQGWLVIVLLAMILGALYSLVQQLERFIRVVIRQRELLVHPDDDALRFELKVFLEEANRLTHEVTRRSLEERGITIPKR